MPTQSVQVAGSGTTVASTFEAHPQYTEKSADWTLLDDVYRGERAIKSKTTTYLPSTAGMRALGLGLGSDGNPKEGQALYNSYIARARFPDWYRSTVVKLLGLATREAAVIELPGRLQALANNATPQGETLQILLRKIFEAQFKRGRFGIMVDIDASRNLPYFATYEALSIVNWDDTIERQGADVSRRLEFVLLDESRYERSDVAVGGQGGSPAHNRSWQWVPRARILSLDEAGRYSVQMERGNMPGETITPTLRGRSLDEIPFVFCNAMDNLPDPDEPPLIGLASIALQAYRTDADYRQALFNQGQDTLVIRGGNMPNADPRDAGQQKSAEHLVGAGAAIIVPENGDAKFIGVESKGLAELRQALNDSKAEAGEYGGELLSAAGGGESGEALATRIGARTANLPGIVKTGASALERALRIAAVWAGENPDDVKVEPNMDFVEDMMAGEEAAAWIGAKQLGFPISYRTLHEMAQRRDATERSYEEELDEIERERGMMDENEGGFRGGDLGEGAGNPDDDIGNEDDQEGGDNGRNPPQQ